MTEPSLSPPSLAGFEHLELLGSGGFADVFRYRQVILNREVAVKVLRSTVADPAVQAAFVAEAKLMASVSTHPYIVTVFGADVAQDGRPYLIMEYYPRPHFGLKMKPHGVPVAEALRVGVQLASAVETAHRAGILHRDIKPANVLSSEYDRPGLTDFGISGAHADGSAGVSLGFSTAYAPPEVLLDTNPGDERSDVYALAATVYAFVSGRAPFDVPGGDNSRAALTRRVLADPVPRTGRNGIPESLEHLLRLSLSKNTGDRAPSASTFARQLQQVQQELHLEPTALELREEGRIAAPDRSDPTDQDGTRLGRVQVVDPHRVSPLPQAHASPSVPAAPAFTTPTTAAAAEGPATLAPSEEPGTIKVEGRQRARPQPEPITEEGADRRRLTALVAGGMALAVVVVVALVVVLGAGGGPETEPQVPTTAPSIVIAQRPPVPDDIALAFEGGVVVARWRAVNREPGDEFVVVRRDQDGAGFRPIITGDTVAEFDAGLATEVCVEVSTLRGGQESNPSPVVCVVR